LKLMGIASAIAAAPTLASAPASAQMSAKERC
jgi:hypothetical protein